MPHRTRLCLARPPAAGKRNWCTDTDTRKMSGPSFSWRKYRPATFTSTTTTTTGPTAVTTAIAACKNCCQMLLYLPRLKIRCSVRGFACMYVCNAVRDHDIIAAARTMQTYKENYCVCTGHVVNTGKNNVCFDRKILATKRIDI